MSLDLEVRTSGPAQSAAQSLWARRVATICFEMFGSKNSRVGVVCQFALKRLVVSARVSIIGKRQKFLSVRSTKSPSNSGATIDSPGARDRPSGNQVEIVQ